MSNLHSERQMLVYSLATAQERANDALRAGMRSSKFDPRATKAKLDATQKALADFDAANPQVKAELDAEKATKAAARAASALNA